MSDKKHCPVCNHTFDYYHCYVLDDYFNITTHSHNGGCLGLTSYRLPGSYYCDCAYATDPYNFEYITQALYWIDPFGI